MTFKFSGIAFLFLTDLWRNEMKSSPDIVSSNSLQICSHSSSPPGQSISPSHCQDSGIHRLEEQRNSSDPHVVTFTASVQSILGKLSAVRINLSEGKYGPIFLDQWEEWMSLQLQ